MTEIEAIEKLKNMRLFMQITDKNSENRFSEDDYKANEMAIQALEEVQARDKKVWHHSGEIPGTEDCYIVAWLPKVGQCKADSPHYYAIWSYEDGEWQIYVPNDFADKEIVLLAWTELPEPYNKECEENKVIDTDKIVERLENASYERFGNDGMGGELVVNLDDAIEIVKDGGKE